MAMVVYRKYVISRGSYFENGSELWTFLIDDRLHGKVNNFDRASHLDLFQLAHVATVKDPVKGHEVIVKSSHDTSEMIKAGLDAMCLKYHTSENVRESFKQVELLASMTTEE